MNFTESGITGQEVRRLMRVHRVTIRELARRIGLPMTRVRFRRLNGGNFLLALDWWQAITGSPELTPRLRAALHQYVNR